MSKENLVLAQILKQADKGRWFTVAELESICDVYDIKMEDLKTLVKRLKKKGIL